MALNPPTGTGMLLKSMRFLWLRSLGTSSYKKGKHGRRTALGTRCLAPAEVWTLSMGAWRSLKWLLQKALLVYLTQGAWDILSSLWQSFELATHATDVKIAEKKDKAFFFWQPYKKRAQMTFASLGHVLIMHTIMDQKL